jgi:copper chaperone NosL
LQVAAGALLAALWCAAPAGAGAAPAEPDRIVACAECGMKVKADNRFTSRVVQTGTTSYFCDMGDLVAYLERTRTKDYLAATHDFTSGEWIAVDKAFFVVDKKTFVTPMGWGIAAFRERAQATGTPLDFEALRKALR